MRPGTASATLYFTDTNYGYNTTDNYLLATLLTRVRLFRAWVHVIFRFFFHTFALYICRQSGALFVFFKHE